MDVDDRVNRNTEVGEGRYSLETMPALKEQLFGEQRLHAAHYREFAALLGREDSYGTHEGGARPKLLEKSGG